MILINIKMSIRPDKMDEWLLLSRFPHAKDVNSEDGCLFFQFARSLTDREQVHLHRGLQGRRGGEPTTSSSGI